MKIYLLGPPQVEYNGRLLTIQRRNVRGLLYRLAADLEPVPRARLCWLFWPDEPEATARRNLSHLLTHLRMALPEGVVLRTFGDLVGLEAQGVWCDRVEFKRLIHQNQGELEGLNQAAALYRGPFLAGFALPGSSEYEHWISVERSTCERLYLETLETLIERETTRQGYDQAIRYALRSLETDDLVESIHGKLIALYAMIGDRNAALRQYERCMVVLERELGVDPLPETRAVYQSVLEGRVPALASQPAPVGLKSARIPRPEVPLVGREQAWSRLEAIWERARAGEGQIVMLAGESGIGKSRLMHDFLARCAPEARVLWGAGHFGEQTVPYHPLVEAFRSAESRVEKGEQAASFSRQKRYKPPLNGLPLYSWIASLGLPPVWLAEVSRLLPEIRSQFPDLPPPMPTEPEDARIRLFDALSRFVLVTGAAAQVTILCLDDLQWADRTTQEWLIYFARQLIEKNQTERCHLLVLSSYRDEDAEELATLRQGVSYLDCVAEIKLGGLDQPAVLKLLRHLAGSQPEDDLLAGRLWKATDGNPLFLLELFHTLSEEGGRKGDWSSALRRENFPLPKGIVEMVQGRLPRLDARTRQVLDACSVFASTFRFDWVQLAAGRNEIETMDSLDRLVARHWIVEREGSYHFVHDLARQVVEAGLSPVRRQLLHRRAGRVLEKMEPDAASALAYHFDLGGELQKALQYHDRAARQASTLFAWREAGKHLTRMLANLQQLDPLCSDPICLAQRVQILTSRAHIHYLQGQLAERDADLAAVTTLAEASGDEPLQVEVLHHRIRYLNLDGRYEEAIAHSEKGLELAVRLGNDPSRSRFLAQIGFAHYFLGRPRQAMAALEPALGLLGCERDPERHGRIIHILGYVHFHLGDYGCALACQQEALACHQQVGDENRVAWDLVDIGNCLQQLGQLAEARRTLEDGLALARRIGARPAEAYGLAHLGDWEAAGKNYPAARSFYQQALAIQETLHTQHVTIAIETGLGLVYYHQRNLAKARLWLDQAVEHARAIGHRRWLSEALIGLGKVEITAGQQVKARAYLLEAVEVARECECRDSLEKGEAALAGAGSSFHTI